MIKAIFFDWGHTFTSSGFVEAKEKVNDLLKPHNLTWDDFYSYFRNLYLLRSSGKIKSDREMFNWLGKILRKENLPFKEIGEAITDSQIIPHENIEIVKEIKKNYKVGLLTNNVQEWVEKVLKNYKIEDLFDAVIVSSRVGTRKPGAQIFYFALKSLSVKPEETIFVSDELSEDLIGAKGCGIKTIWLDDGLENEWKQKERKIAELFKPDAIIKNLKESLSAIKIM